jgi:hypothetical protein
MNKIRRCIARNSGLRFVGKCSTLSASGRRVTLISKKSPSKYYQQLGGVNTGLTESRKSQVGEGKRKKNQIRVLDNFNVMSLESFGAKKFDS